MSLVLENTPTTVKVDKIELGLASLYRKFGTLIISDKEFPNIARIKDSYNNLLVAPVTKRAVHDIYLAGVDYVNLLLRTQGFLTINKDDPRIESISKEMVDTFWRKIRIFTDREIERNSAFQNNVDPKTIKKRLNLNFMLSTTATTLSTWTLKEATVNKLIDMRDQIENLDYRIILNELKASAALKGIGRAILEDINAVTRTGKQRKLTVNDIHFIWESRQDELTCLELPNGQKGCRFLHGKKWRFDQANEVPSPAGTGRNPTHYNCRCRIIIQIGKYGFYA